MRKRNLSSLALFLAIIFLPYWIYLPLLLVAVIIFPLYWEGILFGFFIDILYGRGVTAFPSLLSPIAFITVILIIVLLPLRERLRFNV
ncbi:MAG: hypothetical protein EXS69_00150 [Candidatus Zambryskibacteria bacterium]|nr:hypothetical protein [Candidatus Zambryskibacteria bacterium]